MRYYTGIGSRDTPPYVCDMMTQKAIDVSRRYILRSGGANGADAAFEMGADKAKGAKEIYLPWRGFNNNQSPLYSPTAAAIEMAKKYHPRWERLNRTVRLLHARNCHQVLGLDLKTPSEFLVCWTPGGRAIGGTATAIKIAYDWNIPVTNLGSTNP